MSLRTGVLRGGSSQSLGDAVPMWRCFSPAPGLCGEQMEEALLGPQSSRAEALRGTVPWGCRGTGPLVSPPHAASPGDGARAHQSEGTGEGEWVHT